MRVRMKDKEFIKVAYHMGTMFAGKSLDYKIEILAGKEDCFYEYVHPGATLYVAFQVLKGGDGQAGFAVRNPQGQIVRANIETYYLVRLFTDTANWLANYVAPKIGRNQIRIRNI